MDYKQIAAQVLWQECLSAAVGKRVKVSLYPKLSESISDKNLLIQEAIGYHEADEVSARLEEYLSEFSVFPILGILGGNVLCIGIAEKNLGVVFYYDFDFGIFELSSSVNVLFAELI